MKKYVHIRINELLEERRISKNRTCKDLDLARGNFNRYCRDEFCIFRKNCASVPEERSAIPLETEQSSAS